MNKKYILTDLDGTLLGSDKNLSKTSIEIINDALYDGHVISYSTARSYASSKEATRNILWQYPVVLYNGALIYDPISKKTIHGYYLSLELSRKIIEIVVGE